LRTLLTQHVTRPPPPPASYKYYYGNMMSRYTESVIPISTAQ